MGLLCKHVCGTHNYSFLFEVVYCVCAHVCMHIYVFWCLHGCTHILIRLHRLANKFKDSTHLHLPSLGFQVHHHIQLCRQVLGVKSKSVCLSGKHFLYCLLSPLTHFLLHLCCHFLLAYGLPVLVYLIFPSFSTHSSNFHFVLFVFDFQVHDAFECSLCECHQCLNGYLLHVVLLF